MNKEYIKIGTNYVISDDNGSLRVLQTESKNLLNQKLQLENKIENMQNSYISLENKLNENKKRLRKTEKSLKKGRIKFIISCFTIASIITFLSLITKITYTYLITLLLPFSVVGLYCLIEAAINFIGKYKSKIKLYKENINDDKRNLTKLSNQIEKEREKLNSINFSDNIKFVENVEIQKITNEPKISIEDINTYEKESIKKLELK